MLKIPKYDFQWFEKEDHRKNYRASISRDGKLRIGKALCGALPRFIQVGFDEKQKVLAIADGHGAGIGLPKYGIVSTRRLSAKIAACGLKLPISFLFVQDAASGFFLGRILPRRRRVGGSGRREYDAEQLLVLYRHVVDLAVGGLAKSTPLAERRSCAMEAFYAAVKSYCPGYGDLEAYLEGYIHDRLLAENKQYSAAYGQRSLDQPLTGGEGDSFCLYDTLSGASSGIDRLEERIMAEQFLASLSSQEQTLCRMLQEGRSLAQIAGALGLAPQQLTDMGRRIGQKRQDFYRED